MNSTLSFLDCRLNSGGTQSQWKNSNLTCCNQICLNFFAVTASRDVKTPLTRLFAPLFTKLPCETVRTFNYHPQKKWREGNVFAPVCHSVHRGVMISLPVMDSTSSQDSPPPQGWQPPWTAPPMVNKWAVPSYWNAFLFTNVFCRLTVCSYFKQSFTHHFVI